MLNCDRTVPVRLMIFDLLQVDGADMTRVSYSERRQLLEQLDLNGPNWTTPDVFDDGDALYGAVCERGLEGVVAKWRRSSYRPGVHGWIKTKNPGYWRRQSEVNAVKRSVERRARTRA
jgi:bifunctional non-homologous end joining protein LigD